MAGDVGDDLPENFGLPLGLLASDVDQIVTETVTKDPGSNWIVGSELNLGSKRWRPAAVSEDGKRLLHACLSGTLPRFVVERLKLASSQGISTVVLVTVQSLFSPSVLEELTSLDSDVYVLGGYDEDARLKSRHVLAAAADISIPLDASSRVQVASACWQQIEAGTSHQKGRRLEALLAFIFGQVRDLKVVERNYRTASEEIDIVLQVDNFSPRVWQQSGVPFVLVEAKNRVDKVSQEVISAFLTKMQTKRGTVRIGLVVSLAGFTRDAYLQTLRFSTQNLGIAMIDREALRRLVTSQDLDGELESQVRHALLE